MLKHIHGQGKDLLNAQPPSGGCVLKPLAFNSLNDLSPQPPSGGCVLKHYKIDCDKLDELAATFGWLCVETSK